MLELNEKILLETNEVFKRLNNLRRWTAFVTEEKYNELAKQSLNCITVYLLAAYNENAGIEINWPAFPRIALFRAFQKAYVTFSTPEIILKEIAKIGGIDSLEFEKAAIRIIAEKTSPEFAEYLSQDLSSYEYRLYRAATRVSTYVELLENSSIKDFKNYEDSLNEVYQSFSGFSNVPYFEEFCSTNNKIFKLLSDLSKLRNQNRWAADSYAVECSVLGHLFDTAAFAYFIATENFSGDETMATKFFFMGIFHDIAETWTTDIPSSIKDLIPGYRNATEEYEDKILKEKLYSLFDNPFILKKVKDVMFESAENLQYKKLIKGADYLSGDSECWRQYKAGTRDTYFLTAMERTNRMVNEGTKVEIPTECNNLRNILITYVRNLSL